MTAGAKKRLKAGGSGSEQKILSEIPEDKPKYWDPLIEGVKWIERYSEPMEKFFDRIPSVIASIISTFAVFTFGSTLRGEWVVILVTALKQMTGATRGNERNVTTEEIFSLFTEQNLKMEHFGFIFICAHVVSYSMYFIMGGFLHWYFYVNRRDRAKEWKLQPDKWLSPELERHEIMVGTMSLFVTGSFSAFLACYILNGNPSTVYYQFDEYGWLWFFLQFPAIFVYSDYTTYTLHRLYHTPFLYKNFHKLHHKYKQPTAFSVTAIHPVEIMHVQLTMCLPLFIVPVHWLPFYVVAIYNYYHGILDHSGINFKSQWWQPWQPDAAFHDDHHLHFHCNFGFNMYIWDIIHGTMRKINRLYTEDNFSEDVPHIDSTEAKAIIESDPDLKEDLKYMQDNLKTDKYTVKAD